ncbi:hypothetical protein A2U01_0029718 [Trifolium medium]|uniref:Uncharacterized protein n=1 Tax=Trifolium medium TaxID=97028 RepID=A0A392P941_9FABA|nr:hypothetical protein [Trifolium medium]
MEGHCCGCLENLKKIFWVASVPGAARRGVGAAHRQSFRKQILVLDFAQRAVLDGATRGRVCRCGFATVVCAAHREACAARDYDAYL